MTTLRKQLVALGACPEAIEWVNHRSLAEAWAECPRADWLLWLAAKMLGQSEWPTHSELVLAACDCAETALVHIPAGEDRPRKAIEAARGWARGEVPIMEVEDAIAAADAATAATYAADAPTRAAANAARAATCACATTAYATAGYAARAAACATACATVDYSARAARAHAIAKIKARAEMADLVRRRLQPGELPEEKS